MKININKIKELRNITGISIIECKKALVVTKGNINNAINYIRQYLTIESIKKSNNVTKEGIIFNYIKEDVGVLLEINCQTDFVAKSINFINFGREVLNYIIKNNQYHIKVIQKFFNKKKIELIGIFKENISINKICYIQGKFIGKYIHHNKKIGVIIKSNINNPLLMKQIAMHIAMLKPEYIQEQNIPSNIINQEYELQKNIAIKENKPQIILKKIIEGRIKKFVDNITLYNQKFLLDNNQTVFNILNKNKMKILNFVCLEIGSKTISN